MPDDQVPPAPVVQAHQIQPAVMVLREVCVRYAGMLMAAQVLQPEDHQGILQAFEVVATAAMQSVNPGQIPEPAEPEPSPNRQARRAAARKAPARKVAAKPKAPAKGA